MTEENVERSEGCFGGRICDGSVIDFRAFPRGNAPNKDLDDKLASRSHRAGS